MTSQQSETVARKVLSEAGLWNMCGDADAKKADFAFTTLLDFRAKPNIRFDELDPITRLYHVLLVRGEKVTTRMLAAFVDAVGAKVVHPALARLLEERRNERKHKVSKPDRTRSRPMPRSNTTIKLGGDLTVEHVNALMAVSRQAADGNEQHAA
ncbi:MAG: hypothetical protein P4M11_06115 [Candidatus Pacebacteria bacterium]|nr:hypothetical protein [Candidatus Paceibacterota bacterium]